jgi:predicted transcriptional regulator
VSGANSTTCSRWEKDQPVNNGKDPKARNRRARGELEGSVLAALWSADGPLTAAQVRDLLPGNAAYTTVLTALTRLHAKGMLTRGRTGRENTWAPVTDEATHTAALMRDLLESGSDHQAVLQRFVTGLSTEDESLLQRLLRPRPEEGEAR